MQILLTLDLTWYVYGLNAHIQYNNELASVHKALILMQISNHWGDTV